MPGTMEFRRGLFPKNAIVTGTFSTVFFRGATNFLSDRGDIGSPALAALLKICDNTRMISQAIFHPTFPMNVPADSQRLSLPKTEPHPPGSPDSVIFKDATLAIQLHTTS
jgi:hypothetical protein